MKMKKIASLVIAGMMAVSLAACGSGTGSTSTDAGSTSTAAGSTADASTASDAAAQGDENLTGKVTMSGSTSMEKLASAMQEAFMEVYPNVTVTAEFTGSSAGIEAVTNKTVDIGNASRALADEEKSAGIVENIVAIDGIAVITDPANKVNDLTTDELKQIYLGEVTNWKDLGGDDEAIVVIGREAGSGTRSAFEELLESEDQFKYASELDSTGAVMAKVAATPGAIGYVSLDVIDDTVQAMKLNGVEPSEETILSGDYMLQRPFVMATNGEISAQSEATQKFFEFIQSDAGKQVIETVGLIVPQS